MSTVFAGKVVRHLLVCVAAQLAACASSIADEAEIVAVEVVKDWTVYRSEAGDFGCGIIARPMESMNTKDGRLADVKRGDIVLAVAVGPGWAPSRYRLSFRSGYPFRRDSTVTMRVGNRTFTLETGQTEADSEWAWPPADDDAVVEAMKRGTDAVLTGVSRRNTDTRDTFSLLGMTDALEIAEDLECASIADRAETVGVAVVGDWTAYRSRTGDLECGIIARPMESINTKDGKLAVVKRGDILLAVTIDPSRTSSRYLVSFRSGYPFRRGSAVSMQVDKLKFILVIGEREENSKWAWPLRPTEDDVIVEAMKRGVNAVLTAVSRRNTDTSGLIHSFDAIACSF
ncbi:MAG: hypothetical protein OXQ89_22250 [Rhodospirillaceae bacterium]|nr:hypothetical protein [Rhodospirillaceae bacterium]